MKIPLVGHEIKWHSPGAPADNSPATAERAKTLPRRIANSLIGGLPVKIRSTSDAETARRLRGKFTHLAQKAVELSAAGASPPKGQRVQANAGDASWAGKNGRYSDQALRDVRLALYSREHGSFKSSNKFSTSWQPSEIESSTRGTVAIYVDPSAVNSRHSLALRSKNIWQSDKINCDGLAVAVSDYVAHKYPLVPVSIGALSYLHRFAIIGAIRPEQVNLPLDAWPSHIYVCDPWANISCPAPEYPAKFRQKMEKWHGGGKQISVDDGDNWISPLDPKWVSCVQGPLRVATRRQFTDGQFDEVLVPSKDYAGLEFTGPQRPLSQPVSGFSPAAFQEAIRDIADMLKV